MVFIAARSITIQLYIGGLLDCAEGVHTCIYAVYWIAQRETGVQHLVAAMLWKWNQVDEANERAVEQWSSEKISKAHWNLNIQISSFFL